MALDLVRTTPDDIPALTAFLLDAYRLPADAPFVNRTLMEWKYFAPRPDWDGARSYLIRPGDRIMAHGCVVPVTFATAAGCIRGIRVIDWAGGRGYPGAGVMLMRRLAEQADVLMAVGGSPDTLRVLPRVGFAHRADSRVYVRVARPWRQARTDPFPRGWKAPLRLARNAMWAAFAGQPQEQYGWSADRINGFEDDLRPVLAWRPPDIAEPVRTPGMMSYMLGCPGAAIAAFAIRERGRPSGFFLISRAGGQARIADVRVASHDAAAWTAAYALATRAALDDPGTCEIVAVTALDHAARALEANGFRLRRTVPILLSDARGALAGIRDININMLEGDEAYVWNPLYPFET